MRHLTWLIAAAVFATSAAAQDVRYEKYTLDNGLTVILHEDHALPVGAINLWYRVGARNEPPGRSGFAHLFEHLMFMGTQRVPNGQFDATMEAAGGANNASTSLDRTNYFSAGPASLIPTLLWLDADRLEDLARAMTEQKLNLQRDVVRNEIRQQVENTPYGRAEESMYRLMYPPGHPYHEAVYGTHADLEAATVFNVKDFFSTYYVPSNCSLVVAGDFDSATIKPLIAGLFGTLAQGAPVAKRTADPVSLGRVVRETMTDKVQLPMIRMVWHSPAAFAEGDAEMDLVAALLAHGKNSRLYKRLVFEDKTAVDVSARQESSGLGSLFIVDVQTNPDADLRVVEKTVDEELSRLAGEGVTPSELEERKATIELGKLSAMQTVEAIADKLNEYEYIWGEPNSFKRDLDRYRTATPAKVQWWAKRVLDPGQRAIITVLPEQPQHSASARDQRPEGLPPKAFDPTPPQAFALSSGVSVMLWRKPELPLAAITAVFAGSGPLDEPARAGLAGLAAQMTEEGAGDLDALQFASALQSLGASYNTAVAQESASAGITVLKRNLDKAIGLMADALRRPRNAAPDWDRIKRLRLEELRQQMDEPAIVAARVGLRALFGDESPYGWPTDGTPETVGRFSLQDVTAEQGRVFGPERLTLLVAGDVTPEEARPILEKAFGDWKGQGSAPSASSMLRAKEGGMRVLIVDRPAAVQTVIRFVMPGPSYKDERRVPLRLMNTILGGSFTSRLNQNLREAHGYTYGAGSRFVMNPSTGYFIASANVKADVTGASLKEFLAEFERLRKGDVSPDETIKARETLRTDVVQAFQGLRGLLSIAADLVANGVPYSTLSQDLARMQSATADELNALTREAVPLDRAVLVLVGDKGLILKQLKDLGLPEPREVTAAGEPVKSEASGSPSGER
jgi:predicted Zn-dependent peptidase